MSRFPTASRRLAIVGVALATAIAPTAIVHAVPPPDQEADQSATGTIPINRPTAIVAFGDSFISGEGAGAYKTVIDARNEPSEQDGWTDDNSKAFYCHRSSNAFVEVARLPGIDARINLACSGAIAPDIANASSARDKGRNVKSQIAQFNSIARSYDVKAIVIGLGANNTQFTFGQIALGCASRFATDAYTRDEQKWYRRLTGVAKQEPCRYDELRPAEPAIAQETLDAARAIITEVRRREGDDFKVIMQGYTSPLTPRFDLSWAHYAGQTEALDVYKKLFGLRFDGGCPVHDGTLDVATQYTEFLSDNALTSRDKLAAEFPGIDIVYLDVKRAFDGARLCEPKMAGTRGSLVTPLRVRYPAQGNPITFSTYWKLKDLEAVGKSCEAHYQLCQESLHPNKRGHWILGKCLSAAVRGSSEYVECSRDPNTRKLSVTKYPRHIKFNSSIATRTDGSTTVVDITYNFDQGSRNLSRGVKVTTDQRNAAVPAEVPQMAGVLEVRLPCTLRGRTTHIDVKAWSLIYGVVFEFTRPYDVPVASCPIAPPNPGEQLPPGNVGGPFPGGPAGP